jgi:hypothetical protein
VKAAYNRKSSKQVKRHLMNNEELISLIIKELSRHRDRQEIVRKICEASTLTWSEAEKFITEVEDQNKRKIAVRRGPLLLFLSIGTLVLGIGLLAYNMELIIAIFNRDLFGQILGLQGGYYRLVGLATGLAMTIGGLYGIWTTLASFIPDSK